VLDLFFSVSLKLWGLVSIFSCFGLFLSSHEAFHGDDLLFDDFLALKLDFVDSLYNWPIFVEVI